MDKIMFRVILGMTMFAAAMFAMALLTMAWAEAPASFLCKTNDTQEYIDVVSTGKNNKVLVQVNGGDFLPGDAEFDDPILYVTVPVNTGVFVIAFDVRKQMAAVALRTQKTKQTHEMVCVFR